MASLTPCKAVGYRLGEARGEWDRQRDGQLGIHMTRSLARTIERTFPEKRVFLKSDSETRFVRLSPGTQAIGLAGCVGVVAWALLATAILTMNALGAGDYRQQAEERRVLYEQRLNELAQERDQRASEASEAQARFALALAEVSAMQGRLLASETRRAELETGLDALQTTLVGVMRERDEAQGEAEALAAELEQSEEPLLAKARRLEDSEATLKVLAEALGETAGDRDSMVASLSQAETTIGEMELAIDLMEERNDRIFQQLEEAVSVSLEPLDDMFRSAGLPADSIIETVRRGYSGQGGPLQPISFSTKGELPDPDSLRANAILGRLDDLNLYRIAVQKTPFAQPVLSAFRFTSGFGPRSDPKTGGTRMHEGTDFAAGHGTPIYSTADGVVTHAGWLGGYGRLVKIKHQFGIETRYAHMSRIRVNVGDRVSRGDRIGDMGNSGRSTGTHLHYEVRLNGKPVNPMTYIKAARDVF